MISRQRIANTAIGGVAFLLVLLAIILVKYNHESRRANKLLDEKVQQRTAELELNQNALQRAWQERDMVINKACGDIKSSMATIKGLCFLGLKDIDHPKAPEYLHKMDNTSDQLFNILNAMTHSIRADEDTLRNAN